MASTRAVALAATGVLAIVAAAIIAASAGSGGGSRSADAGGPSAAGAASATTSATGSASPGRVHGTSTPSGTPRRSPGAGSPTGSAGGADGSTDVGAGAEVLPTPAGDPTSTDYSLPPVPTAKPAPLLGTTLPKPAVAKGRLVTGFPTALAPPRGTAIRSSSVSVDSDVLQAALVATGGDPDAILSHYRGLLSARGFAEKKTQGVENGPAAAFRHGKDNVTITTVDGKTYLIANLRPTGA